VTATLLLRFDGPLQAWSVAAFADRPTLPFPTKSGIIGMLASALGRRREERIDDLVALSTSVRADEAGRALTDFQTAGSDGWRSADGRLHTDVGKIRRKGFLADAVFTAALTGADEVIERTAAAVTRPVRPLFLGRRCCPPAAPLLIGISSLPALDALAAAPYQGHRSRPPAWFLAATEAAEGARGESWDDLPLSFAVDRREYGSRSVRVFELEYIGPGGSARAADAAEAVR
jgi:CRISPR system Cascade subunit CasD